MAAATRSLARLEERGSDAAPVCRFAPSITGAAHPGTLLAALLCWLDARSHKAHLVLRLEDLDTTRLRPGQREDMRFALSWFGLDWDEVLLQSTLSAQHEAALDTLAEKGLLYPCSCSRKERRTQGRRSPDGGFAYSNRCRQRPLPPSGWRQCDESLRVRLSDRRVELVDEGGLDLGQTPAVEMGDPIVRRRDGVYAYHLVVVVDDGASGVTRVVRGRDLATSTATQILLQDALALPHPVYRHHFLLLESRGKKLAKLHGSMPFTELRERFDGAQLCGLLGKLSGLHPSGDPCSPQDLLSEFCWDKVRDGDLLFEA